MLAKFPSDNAKTTKKTMDWQILRLGVIAELDAITLYEQLASAASDRALKAVLMDVALEEKTHVGEFMTLLVRMDKEQAEEMAKGEEEVDELSGK